MGREARPTEWSIQLLKGRWALLLGLVALGGVLLTVPDVRQLLAGLLDAASRSDGAAIRDAIRSYGSLAPAASIALILLHMVIPLPAELMALANGLAFGFWGGLAVSWSGFMLSALMMYAAGRLWGRPLLDRAVSQRHRERLDGWLEQEGAFPLLAVRLVPLVPFNTVCLVVGVIRAPLWTYVWTTGVGILPLGAMLSLLGSRLGESSFRLGATFWVPNAIFLIAILTTWWVVRRRTRRRS
ncbi:MAG: VTT domain-containing protein [Actinomycetota bacterium]|nr:VTT domain-containing protein [Actinomycetota bacterium]